MTGAAPPAALLLSIKTEHADRIFAGTKQYELRKALPRRHFRRVYLYESGGAGIVGYFDAGEPLRMPLEDLWRTVGDRATSRERFLAYFAGREFGCAIPVQRAVRLSKPLMMAELRTYLPKFTAPQGYLYVEPGHPLWKGCGSDPTTRILNDFNGLWCA